MTGSYEARILTAEAAVNRLYIGLASDEARLAAVGNMQWVTAGQGGQFPPAPCTWQVNSYDTNFSTTLPGAFCQVLDPSGNIVATGTTAMAGGLATVTMSFLIPSWLSGAAYQLQVSASGKNPSPYVEYEQFIYFPGAGWPIASNATLY